MLFLNCPNDGISLSPTTVDLSLQLTIKNKNDSLKSWRVLLNNIFLLHLILQTILSVRGGFLLQYFVWGSWPCEILNIRSKLGGND